MENSACVAISPAGFHQCHNQQPVSAARVSPCSTGSEQEEAALISEGCAVNIICLSVSMLLCIGSAHEAKSLRGFRLFCIVLGAPGSVT